MMSTLENLWYGNIDAQENFIGDDKHYKKLMALMCKNEDGLRDTLTDKQKEMLDKFDESTSELNGFLEYKAFRYGFTLAMKIVFECLDDIKEEDIA